MKGIVKGYNFILTGMATLSGVAMVLAFVLIVVDVMMRILGFKPPLFTIAVVEYILLWFTMLAAPWLVRLKAHVFIDAVTQFLPPKIKKFTAKTVYVICIISSSIYCYNTFLLFWPAWQSGIVDVRSIDMPQWFLYAPMPVCFFFVTIEFGRYLIGIDDMYSQALDEREGM